MPLSPIFESFLQDRSRSGSTDICTNLYPEHTDGADGPEISLLVSCPGLTAPLATIGTGPIRGEFRGSNNIMYVVSGNALYAVTTAWSATFIGTIGSSTGPVVMVDNPTQLMVVDGIGAWMVVKATNVITQTVPNGDADAANPTSMIYQDGFAIINSTDNDVYQTNYNDFSTLVGAGAVNNAFIQGNPDPVIALFDIKREVWMFKKNAVEVWVNNGNAGFAFSQLQGVYVTSGCAAHASIAKLADNMVWLGESDLGVAEVYISSGYQAKPITTHALTTLFQTFSTVSDAQAYSYQSGEHQFYVLTFPTAGYTFAYDLMTGKWHQRASFVSSTGKLTREIANCHCWFNKTHVVGDYQNGNIYALSDEVYTDNGAPKKWIRSWRALPSSAPVGMPMSFDELQILMETGITVPDGYKPKVMLRWSDDGGYTWPGSLILSAGNTGQTTWRVIARRLGSTKIGTGMDRVWEISCTDPIRALITGATFEGGPS